MGLFSNRYKTVVGTTVTRVIEDSNVPDSRITGVMKGVLNNGSLPDFIMEELVASIGMRADRMYKYAQEHFPPGLPTGTLFSSGAGSEEVGSILSAMEGAPVTLEYQHLGPPNALHFAWVVLVTQHGYDPETNLLGNLSAAEGEDVYLEDLVVVVPESRLGEFEPGALDQWGTPASSGYAPSRSWMTEGSYSLFGHTPVFADPAATSEQIIVKHGYLTPNYTLHNVNGNMQFSNQVLGEFDIPFEGDLADLNADYFQAKYTVNGVTKYWTYRAGSGEHPELDAMVEQPEGAVGSFFPFIYFRFDKTAENENPDSETYLASKKMVKILGMDFDGISEAIHSNPDIDQVEQAMMVLAVPANTEDQQEMAYLYEFFDKLYHSRGGGYYVPALGTTQFLLDSDGEPPRYTIGIEDARFKMALSDAGIFKTRRVGSLGDVGTCNMAVESKDFSVGVRDPDTGEVRFQSYPIKTHFYRVQTSQFMFDELAVVDLKMMYQVLEGYATTADEEDDILMIPIDRAIVEAYSISDRERLYSRSLHFVFNCSQVVKIKWYQTEWFKAVMVIVAIIITVFTYYSDGGSAIAAALSLTGAAGLIVTIIFNLVMGKLLTSGYKLFVREFGSDTAQTIAILALLYGAYEVVDAGSIAGAPWAIDMIKIANGLQQAGMAGDMNALVDEANEFKLYVDEAEKSQKELQKLLDGTNRLDPFVIFGEAPQDFYNRTVHSGNIGALGISAISNYVDIALTLPQLSATIGET